MSVPNDAVAPEELLPISLEVDVDRISKLSHTQGFNIDEFLVTRRGTKIPVMVKTRYGLTIESAVLMYIYDENKKISLSLETQKNQSYGVMLEVRFVL